MSILHEIKNSIYSPEYYETIYHRPFGLSMRYFWSLVVLLSFVATVFLSLIFVPHVYRFALTIFDETVSTFPKQLELTVKDGVASSNVREPFFIDYPPRIKSALMATQTPLPERFLTIDTKEPASVEAASRYRTMILVGKDGLVNNQAAPAEAVALFGTSTNFALSEATLKSWQATYRPYLKLIPPLLVLMIFCFFVIILAFNLIYLFLGALLVMLIGRLLKLSISYGKAYQYGLHAITASIFVDLILLMIPGGLPLGVTLAIMLATLGGIVYINLRGVQQLELRGDQN